MTLQKEEEILMLNGELDEEVPENKTRFPLLGYVVSTLQDPSKVLFESIQKNCSPQIFQHLYFYQLAKQLSNPNFKQNPSDN